MLHNIIEQVINEDPVTVQAVYNYKARLPDELSFSQSAIITDVWKVKGGWWYGSYEGSKGWFPANYVYVMPMSVQ